VSITFFTVSTCIGLEPIVSRRDDKTPLIQVRGGPSALPFPACSLVGCWPPLFHASRGLPKITYMS
jgi:hypothetical protein